MRPKPVLTQEELLSTGIAVGLSTLVRGIIGDQRPVTDAIYLEIMTKLQKMTGHALKTYPVAFTYVIRDLDPLLIEPVFLFLLSSFAVDLQEHVTDELTRNVLESGMFGPLLTGAANQPKGTNNDGSQA